MRVPAFLALALTHFTYLTLLFSTAGAAVAIPDPEVSLATASLAASTSLLSAETVSVTADFLTHHIPPPAPSQPTPPSNRIHAIPKDDPQPEPPFDSRSTHQLFRRHNYALICTTRDPATGLDRDDIRLSRICLGDPYKYRCSAKGLLYTNVLGGDGQAHEACDSFCACRSVLPKPRCVPLGGGGGGSGNKGDYACLKD